MMRAGDVVLIVGLAFIAAGCGSEGEAVSSSPTSPAPAIERGMIRMELPFGPGSMAPRLTAGSEGVLLAWWQPLEDPGDEPSQKEGPTINRLMTARLSESWSAPREIVQGDAFFVNWADLPAVVEGPGGARFAHWLEKLGEDTYAYGVQLARSGDDGQTWERLGLLHDDSSPTEHGFVSYVPLADGVQAFWLDGRAMIGESHDAGGPMQLRTASLGSAGPPPPSVVLDERVCECCQTGAALSDEGPIVVYRDRDDSEVRDVAVVRSSGDGGWTEPAILHADGWQIHGCPVNGPVIAADGLDVAVAWFTAAQDKARVLVAFSDDAGASFGTPIEVDGLNPSGRVGVVLSNGSDKAPTGAVAYVSWLGATDEAAEIRLRRVTASGELGEVRRVVETTANRSAGVPQMVRHGDDLVLAWVEDTEPSRIQVGLLPMD